MASKFQNRVDYIDIHAYGLGKVKIEHEHGQHKDTNNPHDKKEEEDFQKDQDTIDKNANQERRMYEKIRTFDKHMDTISYSICAFADRADEKIEMVFGLAPPDKYQKTLVEKVYKNKG